jgi:hypothetical protein
MADQTQRQLLEKAIQRRIELSVEIAALDSLIETYKGLLKNSSTESVSMAEQPLLYREPPRRAKQAAQLSEMLDAARRIIIENNRPMKRGDLVKILELKGYCIEGKDKNKVFGTNVWRSKKFITIEGKGYWPIDVEMPK